MINLFLVIISYFFMEFVAWSSHKYIMHGFLWRWHKDHHVLDGKNYQTEITRESSFEKNDLFFLIYALPAIVLMIIGFTLHNSRLVFISSGIALYGLTYFIIHDIVIHQRIGRSLKQINKRSYLGAILRAHRAHHNPKSKSDFQNFGLLIFPLRFFKS